MEIWIMLLRLHAAVHIQDSVGACEKNIMNNSVISGKLSCVKREEG